MSGSKDLVEQNLRLFLLDTLCKGELGNQDLARLGKHPLLTGGQSTLALAPPQVANNLSDLQHVAGVKLLEIGLVPT